MPGFLQAAVSGWWSLLPAGWVCYWSLPALPRCLIGVEASAEHHLFQSQKFNMPVGVETSSGSLNASWA